MANGLRKILAPACDRIEIAGSIRRGARLVKDIELVAIPRLLVTDLFGEFMPHERNELDVAVDGLLEDGRLESREPRRMGGRYKALRAPQSGIGVDLFVVVPPAQWGAIKAIRTGGAEFSKFLVTEALKRGRRVQGGHVVDEHGKTIDTPHERDFFTACGVAWVEPEARS
jgi:DNA polymerase/3'-5' exonuclease PolX